MICKIGKSLPEIENFLKEKYIQEMVLEQPESILPAEDKFPRVFKLRSREVLINRQHELNSETLPCQCAYRHNQIT